MKFKTHVVGGLSAGVLGHQLLSQSLPSIESETNLMVGAFFIASSVIGSLVPDIDHRGSYIGRRLKPISATVQLIAGHRGLTHSPLFVMGLTALLWFVSNHFLSGQELIIAQYGTLGFSLGLFSHLFLDMITKGGIPLLYPFSKQKFSILPLKTGGFGEPIVMIMMILLMVFSITKSTF